MSTFYVDPEGGNDANTGASFAQRWKTFTSGPTAARIAPGDEVRFMASPVPTSLGVNATFTNLSDTVTLASAVTANVFMCDSAWTASVNVTCAATATRREGTNASSFSIAAGFTTGLVAYKDLGSSMDFSAYEQLSFNIWSTAVVGLKAAGTFDITLCSDAAATVVVDTIPITAWGYANVANIIATGRTGGGAFGNSIRSIGLVLNSDYGADTVVIDQIIACKATSAADSLTLRSLIGKNDGRWFGIRSINGTTVKLDSSSSSISVVAAKGYTGTTETVTCYKREANLLTVTATPGTLGNQINDSGTEGSLITFSGGWDRTDMSTQLSGDAGMTWFDGNNTMPFGLSLNGQNFLSFSRFGHTRCDYGIYAGASAHQVYFDNCQVINSQRDGVVLLSNLLRFSNCTFSNNNSSGIALTTTQNVIADNLICDSNATHGINLTTSSRVRLNTASMKNNGSYGVSLTRSELEAFAATMSSNTTGSVQNGGYWSHFVNSTFGDATEVSHVTNYSNWPVYSTKHDATTDVHRTFMDGALISSETGANRKTASGIGWSIAVTNALRSATNPAVMSVAKIACAANSLVTVKLNVNRTNTGLTTKLVCRGGQITGVASDVTATAAASAASWEELTITFTPTEVGVVEVEAWAYGGTTYTVYTDDTTISQA